MKYHLLLDYNINLTFFLLLKTEGRSIIGHPVLERLVFLRTALEKLKPIDAKVCMGFGVTRFEKKRMLLLPYFRAGDA